MNPDDLCIFVNRSIAGEQERYVLPIDDQIADALFGEASTGSSRFEPLYAELHRMYGQELHGMERRYGGFLLLRPETTPQQVEETIARFLRIRARRKAAELRGLASVLEAL